VIRPWQWSTIGDVLVKQSNNKVVQQGWSPKCHDYPAPEGAWGVLKTTAIQPGRFEPEHNKELPSTLEPKPAIEVQEGDLLLTCAGPRSRCGIPALVRSTPRRLMMSGKMYRFRPDGRVDPRFLELWLLSPVAQKLIDEMKTGISDSGLNLTHGRFATLPVPVPEIDEQLRVVAILEDHLSRLDTADGALANAPRRLVALQESWLAHSMRPGSDELATIGETLEEARGGWSRSKRHLVSPAEGVPYLKMNNVTRRGGLDLHDLVYVEANDLDRDKYGVAVGDVLFNSKNSGDLVGKTALADERVAGAVLNENLMRLRFDDRVEPAFAALWFLGPAMRRCIVGAASASTNVAAVYQKDLVRFPMWLPDRQRQQRLIEEFAGLRDATGLLEAGTVRGLAKGQALRRKLLAAAFSGRLTGRAQDCSDLEKMTSV
jgi:type I restriction enzyme, S subunit